MHALAFALLVPAPADDAPSYTDDVRPILAEHCFTCHGPDPETRAGGVRLDTDEGLRGGESPPVVAGDVDASELFYRVSTDESFDRMPPEDAGEPLTADEVAVLRAWIEGGAQWEPHWAYAPFRPVDPPGDPSEHGAIDAFVDARLDAAGLTAADEAAPRDLVTRVAFDLTGLPPAPELAARFEASPTDETFAEIVDELLGSDAFGEHWARHWMDLARYADSHGFTIDGGRTIWPWRDEVVRAIARDQPFDEFTVEQLAGDLLPDATRRQRIATGFHRNTQVNQEGGAGDEENRVSAVLDRVATTGSVWLGSTIGCAQCHTHKFDPITQTEYFGLFAFFDSTADSGVSSGPTLLVPRGPKEEAAAERWEAEHARLGGELRVAHDASSPGWTTWQPARATGSNGPELRAEVDGSFRVVGQNPVYSTYVLQDEVVGPIGALRLEVLPDGGPGRGGNRNFVLQEVRVFHRDDADGAWERVPIRAARADHEQGVTLAEGEEPRTPYPAQSLVEGDEGPGWAILPHADVPHVLELTLARRLGAGELLLELVQEHGSRHAIGAFRMLVAPEPSPAERPLVTEAWLGAWGEYAAHRRGRPKLPSTLVMEEREVPRVTRRFERGSFLDRREVVEPGFPAALDHFSPRGDDAPAPRTRLDLARWLVDPRNALVHRVTVNRWWQQLMGAGLVVTENDFGLRGARPTHPDLLEWLARDYVEHGFSRRHVLRRIVLSRAYRRTSDAAAVRGDDAGRLFTRRERRRLTGEELRDRMLVAAGVLDRTVGGPPVQPPQPEGVYAFTQSRKSWEASAGTKRFRRSLYTRLWRSAPFPFFTTFDLPAANVACTRRTVSRTPLQALALANDPMVVEIANELGARALREMPDATDAERLAGMLRWTLGRDPREGELEPLAEFLALVEEGRGETAAWGAVARVLFNVDEFSHRP